MVTTRPRDASLPGSEIRRSHPREEPSALGVHAGICAGGGQQWRSLPRSKTLRIGGLSLMELAELEPATCWVRSRRLPRSDVARDLRPNASVNTAGPVCMWLPGTVARSRIDCRPGNKKVAVCGDFLSGSDGTRTRDLRRDKPILACVDPCRIDSERTDLQHVFRGVRANRQRPRDAHHRAFGSCFGRDLESSMARYRICPRNGSALTKALHRPKTRKKHGLGA
jgi:hypothetical protein